MRLLSTVSLMALQLLIPFAAAAATVISVGDGDTLRVEDGGKKIMIRVACIDAPETAQAPYGQQARQALQDLLPIGSTVTLKVQTTDRYGRTVAEVLAENGANAGLTLVQQGHAFAYRQYLKECDEWAYLDREQLAQLYRIGVWMFDGGIERPWDWRAASRGAQRQPTQRPVTLTIINDPKPSADPPPASASGRHWRCREVGS